MPEKLRNLALVAAHFPPSNLVNVHRARLWSQHLREFGWNPIVVTAHHDYYEERLDWDLNALVDPNLEVVRTPALPVRPVRLVGDIGIRSLGPQYSVLSKLAAQRRIDFLHITIPSNYSALLGRMLHASHGVPYGIDYNDPWICEYPGTERVGSKAWLSVRLAETLEPWAVRDASLITGVAASYYEAVLQRHPHLRSQAVTAAMPFGVSDADFEYLERNRRPAYLFDPTDGLVHLMYAGAILPKAHVLLDALLRALALLRERNAPVAQSLRVHFIGTGKRPDDPQGHNVLPYIERYGLAACVDEHPARIPYLDVLAHAQQATANFILGSTEPHYTPSKAFQLVRARRPLFAMLHEASSAADLLHRTQSARVLTLREDHIPSAEVIADTLTRFIQEIPQWRPGVDLGAFAELTAKHSAACLARALDEAAA